MAFVGAAVSPPRVLAGLRDLWIRQITSNTAGPLRAAATAATTVTASTATKLTVTATIDITYTVTASNGTRKCTVPIPVPPSKPDRQS